MKVEFYKHALDQDDIDEVREVLKSIFLTTGDRCRLFESKFSAYTDLTHAVSLSSCTAALHLALIASGIGEGDEVITTPMTFIATITAILHAGATPVLVDCEPDTGLISPDEIKKAITPRSKAIIPVHLYGTMADMKSIAGIARTHELTVIEDAAHCLEGRRDDVRPGHGSKAACYSFYATKNLTCGEGGALATNDADFAENVLLLRLHGMNREAADRHKGLYQHWDMVELGWKYNLSDIQAALLVKQIDRLDSLWSERHQLYARYVSALDDIPGIKVLPIPGKSAHHLFTVNVEPIIRDDLISYLGINNIGAAVNYRSVTELTWFKKNSQRLRIHSCENSERFGAGTISLPFYPGLKDIEVEKVVDVLKKGMNKLY